MGTVFAFTAKNLEPTSVASFSTAYALEVLLKGGVFSTVRGRILHAATPLGHTSGILGVFPTTNRDGTSNLVAREWIHHRPASHPWGEPIPSQCKMCMSTNTLRLQHSGLALAFHTYTMHYKCRTKFLIGLKCTQKHIFAQKNTRCGKLGSLLQRFNGGKQFWLEYGHLL